MNGANASTAVALMRNSPVTHRKMASGVSQRFSESLRHKPCASCAIDPNVLPNTMSPRRVLPRVLITQPAPLLFPRVFLPPVTSVSSPEFVQLPIHRSHTAGRSRTLQQPG